jgi:PAS domain S-box-containing protein
MFSVSTLTIGDVGIVVRPVSSSAHLREILDAVSSIKGIDRAAVDRVHGDTAHVRAHADRPVALASELRSALRQRIVSCTAGEGQLVVELAAGTGPTDRPAADEPGRTEPPRPRPERAAAADDVPAERAAQVAAAEAINQSADLSVLLFDLDARFTAAAGGMHRRLGYEFALMQGRTAREIVPPAVWPLLRPGYVDALAGRARTIDVPLSSGQGTYEAAFRPLTRDGAIVGGMVTVRDVTHQRATERALTEASSVLAAVIDESETPFGLLAPSGRWARVNRAMLDLLGADEASVLTSNLFDRIRPDDTRALERTLNEMIDDRRDRHVAGVRLRGRTGDWVDVTARMTAVRSASGLHGVVLELRPVAVAEAVR